MGSMLNIVPVRYTRPDTPAHRRGRLAVIDIGSSMLRLVVFDHVESYPHIRHNEKIWCALGNGKSAQGPFRMEMPRMQAACEAIHRFRWVAEQFGAQTLVAFATSAVREAENKEDFLTRIEQATGIGVTVLSGEEEARLAAIGAITAMPGAEGIVVDMGGGSLELCATDNAEAFASLPYGVLTLQNDFPKEVGKARDTLTGQLGQLSWLKKSGKNQDLIALGAGMRTIARLHMHTSRYPLTTLHDYTMSREEAENFCEKLLSGNIGRSLSDMTPAFKTLLPYRAAGLLALLKATGCARIRFCSFGLREGLLFTQAETCPVLADPLLAWAREAAEREGKGTLWAENVTPWLVQHLPEIPPRAIMAAALLCDISWRESTPYRGRAVMEEILAANFAGATHEQRAGLALAAYYRHEDRLPDGFEKKLRPLITEEHLPRCYRLGLMLRLATLIDPAGTGNLDGWQLNCHHDEFSLNAPAGFKEIISPAIPETLAKLNRKS